jgi:hypothetical protein
VIRGIHLAQVVEIYTSEYRVGVIFPNLAHVEGLRVSLGGARQHPVAGDFMMPEVGDWGVVAFWTNDPRSGVWLTSVSDRYRHIIPTELLIDDPHARLHHTPGDHYTIEHGEGSLESVWPDGTMLRVTTSKDGSTGSVTKRSERTPRKRTITPALGRESERKDLTPAPKRGPVDVVLEHSSGALIRITADGSFHLSTPKGHAFTLHDSTEKQRDPDDPTVVTATPEEDADRVTSEVVLTSEKGLSITLHDDPVQNLTRHITISHPAGHVIRMHEDPDPQVDVYVKIETGAGHSVMLRDKPTNDRHATVTTVGGHVLEMRDSPTSNKLARLQTSGGHKVILRDLPADDVYALVQTAFGHSLAMRDSPDGDQYVRAQTAGGHKMELRDTPGSNKVARIQTSGGHYVEARDTPTSSVRAQSVGGRKVHLDDSGGVTTIQDPAKVVIDAPFVEIAGNSPVARVGDLVEVTVLTGSSAGVHPGVITSGSAKVTAG